MTRQQRREFDEKTHRAERVSKEIAKAMHPLLKGHGPDVQGAVLADLVSVYFAGHCPASREEMIRLWIKTMRDLIPASEQELFPFGPPWDTPSHTPP